MSGPNEHPFDYAVFRVVPQVEREEFVNAGVILLCRTRAFLGVRIELDAARLLALAPEVDLAEVQEHLDYIRRLVDGDPAAGPLCELSPAERFHWLTTPRSTTIQVSDVHSGLCDDPQAALDDLFTRLVDIRACGGAEPACSRFPPISAWGCKPQASLINALRASQEQRPS